jgi:hypothetical protein
VPVWSAAIRRFCNRDREVGQGRLFGFQNVFNTAVEVGGLEITRV